MLFPEETFWGVHGVHNSVPASRAGLRGCKSEHAGVYILADGQESFTNKKKFARRDLAALKPIAHRGRANANSGGGSSGPTQGFDDGFDCGQHAL